MSGEQDVARGDEDTRLCVGAVRVPRRDARELRHDVIRPT